MNLVEKLTPKHVALIVIDIQNDFCSPEGVMGSKGKDTSGMPALVERLKQLISICERIDIPVLYTQQIYDRGKLNLLQKEQYDLDGKLITCDVSGDGWKFFMLDPPADQVYPKYSYNIFSNKQFGEELAKLGVKTLIITGVSTQICVETAIRNGFDLGYKIVVPEDLVATTSSDPDTQLRTLNLVRKTYGVVSNLKEISTILNKGSTVST